MPTWAEGTFELWSISGVALVTIPPAPSNIDVSSSKVILVPDSARPPLPDECCGSSSWTENWTSSWHSMSRRICSRFFFFSLGEISWPDGGLSYGTY
jgi:hypothetical protein